jgi:tetratricopeptide (TPR) repeat protein
VLLIALPWVVYFPVHSFEFLNYDDDVYVTANPWVARGLTTESISWTLTSPQHGNWHPLTMISHMLDVEIWGMDPAGHHLASVAIHSVSGVLLFLFLWLLTGRRWPSVLVAALFAVHPLNVQSVAWVAERKNVLSTLFWFLALLAYLPYMRRPDVRRYLLVAALFLLGLAAKSVVVTLPLTLLILDWWSRQDDAGLTVKRTESYGRLFVEKIPLLLGSLACGVATMWAQTKSGAMEASEIYPLGVRLGNAVVAYTWYLRKAVWPTDLSAFYPHPVHTLAVWKIVLSGLALVAITALVFRLGRRRPYLTAGWAWYVITMAPMAGVIQVGSQAQADRYAYVPLIGIFIAIAWAAADFLAGRGRAWMVAGSVAGCLVLIALAWNASWNRAHWRNGLTLFERAVQIDPQNMIARGNLGIALVQRNRLTDALAHFREAVAAGPEVATGHVNLATALAILGKTAEAEQHYLEAIRLDPNDAKAHFNLGKLYAGARRNDEAIREFREAFRAEPSHLKARVNLAALYSSMRRPLDVIEVLEPVLEVDPDNVSAHFMMGLARAATNDPEAGIAHLEQAVRLDPDHTRARRALERVRGQPGPGGAGPQ